MANFMTTRQVQELLQVDRTTIYRMADAGRIPAVKVGNQWRFPRAQVEGWLDRQQNGEATEPAPQAARSSALDVRKLMPLECVQQIQDAFADALGVMVMVTDLSGELITQPSNPCGLYSAAELSPVFHRHCRELWGQLARTPSLQPVYVQSHLGLLCARGLIRVGQDLGAQLVVSGIAPANWPPAPAQIEAIAAELEVEPAALQRHIDEVFYLSAPEQARVLGFVQRLADIMAHIISERYTLFSRLQNIAELSKF
jgi:excisionase family DNA binding protein